MTNIKRPSNILELRGSFKKNPQRRRDAEPEAAAFKKTPPPHLTAAEKKIWRDIIKLLAPGVLQQSDRYVLEHAVSLIAEWREDKKEMKTSRQALMLTCLARLGMTPSDRTNVVVPKAKANKFDRPRRAS